MAKARQQPASDERRRLGDYAEGLAASHLESQGFTVIERNWAVREGEIDLIAQRGDLMLFVEVRARRGRMRTGTPAESITPRKAQRLRIAVATYLSQHPEAPPNPRIDAVLVEFEAGGRLLRLEQIENAIEDGV